MIRPRPTSTALGLLAVILASGSAVRAQQAPPPPSAAPPPAVTDPLPTTTVPDPSASRGGSAAPPATQSVAPPIPAPPATNPADGPAPTARQPLVAKPGEPDEVDEVTLPAKPAAILSGSAKWEEAVPSLKASFEQIEGDLAKLGIRPTGRPLAVFSKTDDDGFQYEAMIPIESAPDPRPPEGDGLRFGTTPGGKALRFAHKGSYDDIDGTYETLTAYLDAKDVVVQDRFIEEYVTDLDARSDAGLEINIYALPK